MKKVCIIVPVYHMEPTIREQNSIRLTMKRFSMYDIFLIAPESLDTAYYEKAYPELNIRKYTKWKNDVESYSRLLISVFFYKEYAAYEYMLIIQTDALVLGEDRSLQEFCELGYDYYGAPWEAYVNANGREIPKFRLPKWQKNKLIYKLANVRRCLVGNGGFCLRKIDACIKLLNRHWLAALCWHENEDLFFAYYHVGNEFKVAPYEVALAFAREENLKQMLQSGKMPFGVHAWEKDSPDLYMYLQEQGIV